MYRLSPAARDLLLRDKYAVELLGQIDRAHSNLTRTIATQSLVMPPFYAGVLFSTFRTQADPSALEATMHSVGVPIEAALAYGLPAWLRSKAKTTHDSLWRELGLHIQERVDERAGQLHYLDERRTNLATTGGADELFDAFTSRLGEKISDIGRTSGEIDAAVRAARVLPFVFPPALLLSGYLKRIALEMEERTLERRHLEAELDALQQTSERTSKDRRTDGLHIARQQGWNQEVAAEQSSLRNEMRAALIRKLGHNDSTRRMLDQRYATIALINTIFAGWTAPSLGSVNPAPFLYQANATSVVLASQSMLEVDLDTKVEELVATSRGFDQVVRAMETPKKIRTRPYRRAEWQQGASVDATRELASEIRKVAIQDPDAYAPIELSFQDAAFDRGDGEHIVFNFDIPPGITVIRGLNETGKSTLLKALIRDRRLVGGRMRCAGRDWQEISDAWVKQNLVYVNNYDQDELMELTFRRQQNAWNISDSVAQAALQAVGVTRDISAPNAFESLTDGEKARIRFALLPHVPQKFVALDETFNGLDQKGYEIIAGLMRKSIAEDGKTYVVVDHTDRMLPLCDHVVQLGPHGKTLANGPREAVVRLPFAPLRLRKYFAANHPVVDELRTASMTKAELGGGPVTLGDEYHEMLCGVTPGVTDEQLLIEKLASAPNSGIPDTVKLSRLLGEMETVDVSLTPKAIEVLRDHFVVASEDGVEYCTVQGGRLALPVVDHENLALPNPISLDRPELSIGR